MPRYHPFPHSWSNGRLRSLTCNRGTQHVAWPFAGSHWFGIRSLMLSPLPVTSPSHLHLPLQVQPVRGSFGAHSERTSLVSLGRSFRFICRLLGIDSVRSVSKTARPAVSIRTALPAQHAHLQCDAMHTTDPLMRIAACPCRQQQL
jgi:hypothetical protein